MITTEVDDDNNIVTIIDDTGNDEDLILTWETGEDFITLTQYFNDETAPNLIVLSSMQVSLLKDVLNEILIEEDED
jgi:hypothetical protein